MPEWEPCVICGGARVNGAYCVAHLPEHDLAEELLRWRSGEPMDARGAEFDDHALDRLTRTLQLDDGSVLWPRADFRQARFANRAYFDSAVFSDRVDLSQARFEASAIFARVTFQGEAEFTAAVFAAEVDFSGACFRGSAIFTRAAFQAGATFTEARFLDYTDFLRAGFGSESTLRVGSEYVPDRQVPTTSFEHAEFERRAGFGEARFVGTADFREARFRGYTDFADIRSESMSFKGATLQDVLGLSTRHRHDPRFGLFEAVVDRPSASRAERVLINDFLARTQPWWLIYGLAPCVLILTAIAGVLWGSHASLRGGALPGEGKSATGIAWLSLVALCVMLTLGILRLLVRPLVAHWMTEVCLRLQVRLERTFGLSIATVWPLLVQALRPDVTTGLRRDGRQLAARAGSAIGFACSAGFAALVLGLAAPSHWVLLVVVAVVLLLLAGEALRDASSARERYETSVLATVELNRFGLLRSLHLPLPETRSEEQRRTWQWTYGMAPKLAVGYAHSVPELSVDEARAVAEAIFSEPPLIEYQGWVGAWVESSADDVVPFADGCFQVLGDADYLLAVAIGREPIDGVASERLETGRGEAAVDVPFSISVDSGAISLPPLARDLIVPTRGQSEPLRIPFRTPIAGEHRILVYTLQRTRLLQVLEVNVRIQAVKAAV